MLLVIDCTGHGVPGAFVTMLVKAIERQITSKINYSDDDVSPAKILSIFNQNMKQLLKQESIDSISNAGFDGGVIYYNKKDKILKYAGAETPLFYFEDDELKIIKGSRYSVGYRKCDMDYEYKEHTIEVKDGMQFYLTTDGYLDQNGGEKAFPFGKKRFKNAILENRTKTMAQQKEIYLETLKKYQADEERNDDVTFIGFKV
ncbi:MAG: SpoIIE family protein phosphatase [Campylobacterota bacterium]|nr:SpoIIE family protein phosphatase [Campylobacterota bacterium]